MKKLIVTHLMIVSFLSMGWSQNTQSKPTDTTQTEITAKGVVDPEEAKFNENKTIFAPRTMNIIIANQLKSDGILTKSDTQLKFELTEKYLKVNDKVMSKKLAEKYLAIYHGFLRKTPCKGCPVKFEINENVNVLDANGY